MSIQPNKYIITGTSGTGKSVLVRELHNRGFAVFEEAQRAILTEQLAVDGPDLPAKNPAKFVAALLRRCIANLEEETKSAGPTFFDRGIPDVAAYTIRFGIDPASCYRTVEVQDYNRHVFILSPWREIFVTDTHRGKSFDEYFRFHRIIIECYENFGFKLIEVPLSSVEDRANFVLEAIGEFSITP